MEVLQYPAQTVTNLPPNLKEDQRRRRKKVPVSARLVQLTISGQTTDGSITVSRTNGH